MSNASHDHDVIVVGGGPVGLVLALLLGDRGHHVAVVERWSRPYPLPRAVAADHEIARILQSAGLATVVDELLDPVATDDGRRTVYEAADGEPLLELHVPRDSISGWPAIMTFFQPDVERAIGTRVAAHPNIALLRGLEVVDVRDEGDAAVVEAAPHDDAALADLDAPRVTLRAAYVVGADGANSIVRNRMGSHMHDLGFAFDWLAVDVEPLVAREWDPYHAMRLDPARTTALVSVGREGRRFEFMLLPGESAEEMNRPEVAWQMLAPWDVTPENARLIRHATYTFGARWALVWRQDRLLLAGDAAHVMPPFLGQGMCSGLRDAATLAWRLDLVLSGVGGEQLLEGYGPERREQVREIVEAAVALGELWCVSDPEQAAARDAVLRQMDGSSLPELAWKLGPGIHRDGDPLAGRLSIQARVAHNGTVARLDDLLGGPKFVLLSTTGDPAHHLSPDTRAAWERLGGVSVHVGPDSEYHDVDGRYREWFAQSGVELVLVRPDFYAFGSGMLADADALTRDLTTRLTVNRREKASA